MSKATSNIDLRVVVAQLNLLVGATRKNLEKIQKIAVQARDELQADLVVLPEMSLTGYPPEDLLLRNEFYVEVEARLAELARAVPDIYLLVGYPERVGDKYYNTAGLLFGGKIIAKYHKHELPNYGVFDEKRYFTAGTKSVVAEVKGHKVALAICEDLWTKNTITKDKLDGAELVISLNASPFDFEKPAARIEIVKRRVREVALPIIYANCVGGQDELVFDGGSFVVNAKGQVVKQAKLFQEELLTIDFVQKKSALEPNLVSSSTESLLKEESVYKALVLGVRDYIEKNHFPGAIIGLSGGIDSALTLAIAVDAIGKERVTTVFMPSRYSSVMSEEDARLIAKNFGVEYHEISIEPTFQAFLQTLQPIFKNKKPDITEENLQARCRGTLLMAISNKKHYIVLSTGNKSEISVGYSTLYGDMVGGFCVLKDVPKTLVYELVKYRNNLSKKPLIPARVIDRPPSAELAHGQKDTDSLPPYSILDGIIERYVEQDQSASEIISAGFESAVVHKVIAMINRNEYKRRQGPIGPRITSRAFGRDRRYPITAEI
ncbi:MAG: NAD+ synthase [Gammaproteobacteria bacterium]